LLALLAALWRILKLFVAKENLFSHSPNKILIAIDARDRSINEFGSFCGRRWR
jgi:hypothetical protein